MPGGLSCILASAPLNVLSSLGTYLFCHVSYHSHQFVCPSWALGLKRRGCRPHHPHPCIPSGYFLSLVGSTVGWWGQRRHPFVAWVPYPADRHRLLLGSVGLPPQLLDAIGSLLLPVQLLSAALPIGIRQRALRMRWFCSPMSCLNPPISSAVDVLLTVLCSACLSALQVFAELQLSPSRSFCSHGYGACK